MNVSGHVSCVRAYRLRQNNNNNNNTCSGCFPLWTRLSSLAPLEYIRTTASSNLLEANGNECYKQNITSTISYTEQWLVAFLYFYHCRITTIYLHFLYLRQQIFYIIFLKIAMLRIDLVHLSFHTLLSFREKGKWSAMRLAKAICREISPIS